MHPGRSTIALRSPSLSRPISGSTTFWPPRPRDQQDDVSIVADLKRDVVCLLREAAWRRRICKCEVPHCVRANMASGFASVAEVSRPLRRIVMQFATDVTQEISIQLRLRLLVANRGSRFKWCRARPGNIATPNLSFRGENSGKPAKILPAVLAKIVDWRGFPGDDRTDC